MLDIAMLRSALSEFARLWRRARPRSVGPRGFRSVRRLLWRHPARRRFPWGRAGFWWSVCDRPDLRAKIKAQHVDERAAVSLAVRVQNLLQSFLSE